MVCMIIIVSLSTGSGVYYGIGFKDLTKERQLLQP